MMKKYITAALAAALSLTAAQAAFADTFISPETAVQNSIIGKLDIDNRIFSEHIGDISENNDNSAGTVINPVTYITDTNANVINIINTIVDVQVDSSKISSSFDDLRKSIFDKFNIDYTPPAK